MTKCAAKIGSVALVALGVGLWTLSAQPASQAPAVLEVEAPPGAEITLDGTLRGKETRFEFARLPVGKTSKHTVMVRRGADGATSTHSVLLQPGWQVKLNVRPNPSRLKLQMQTGHSMPVRAIAYSRDGKYLATGAMDSKVIVWDTDTWLQVRTLPTRSRFINDVAFSADGTRLVVCLSPGNAIVDDAGQDLVDIWDWKAGTTTRTLTVKHGANYVQLTNDGERLLAVGRNRASLWATNTGRLLAEFQGLQSHTWGNRHTTLHPKGDWVVGIRESSSFTHVLAFWDPARPQEKPQLIDAAVEEVAAVQFTPDGTGLAQLGRERSALSEVATGKVLLRFNSTGQAATFTPDGKHLVLAMPFSQRATVWQLPSGKIVRHIPNNKTDEEEVRFSMFSGPPAISPNGRHLVMGFVQDMTLRQRQLKEAMEAAAKDDDYVTALNKSQAYFSFKDTFSGQASVWRLDNGKEERVLGGNKSLMLGQALHPDGRTLVTGNTGEDALLVWDLEKKNLERSISLPSTPLALKFAGDGQKLLAVTQTKAVFVDFPTWTVQQSFDRVDKMGDLFPEERVGFMPGNRQFYQTSDSMRTKLLGERRPAPPLVEVRDLATGASVKKFLGPEEANSSVLAVSRDGKQVAYTTRRFNAIEDANENTIFLSGLDDQVKPTPLRGHQKDVNHASFSPDGRWLVSSGYETEVILWDVAQQKLRHRWDRGQRSSFAMPTTATFSPDGRIVCISDSTQTTFRDIDTGELLRTMPTGAIHITFVGGARLFFANSFDGGTRLWDLATGEELAHLLNSGNDWLVVTPDGLFDGTKKAQDVLQYRDGDRMVPVGRFYKEFSQPGLLQALLQGERPRANVELGANRAPLVRIVAPVKGSKATEPKVQLEVEVTSQGGGIGEPWLLHNGARVLVPGEKIDREGVRRQTFRVALVEGANHFEVHATSGDGGWQSEPAKLTLHYDQPLPDKAELHVIAVGINRYADATLNLKYAASDAEAVARLFQERGGRMYARVHVHALLNEQAKRGDILAAFKEVSKKAKPQDTLVVFLAGHGTMREQMYYFLPHDFKSGPSSESIFDQAIAANMLGERLAAIPALKRVLVLDTCQAGGLVKVQDAVRNSAALRGAVEKVERTQGVFTIAAAGAGAEAKELPELGHGVLTYSLLAGAGAVRQGPLLGTKAAYAPQGMDVLTWFSFASVQVPRLTRTLVGREQEVQLSAQGASFVLLARENK